MDYIIDVDYNITRAEANARKLNREIELSQKEAARIKEEISNTTAALEQERLSQQKIREEVSAQVQEAAKLSNTIDRIKNGTASPDEIINVGGLEQAQTRLTTMEQGLKEQEKLYDKVEKKARKLTAQLSKQNISLDKQNNKTADLAQKIRVNTSSQNQFTKANDKSQKSIKKTSTAMTNFGKRIGNVLKSVFIFTVLTKVLTEMRDALSGYLKDNQRLAKSLEQLKHNISTLGATIMNALSPIIQWLVDKLIYVTALLGNILANILGQDIKKMQALAQATEDTADAAKKATASFDTLQTIDTSSEDTSTKMPIEVELMLDKAEKDAKRFSSKLSKIFEPIKKPFGDLFDTIKEKFTSVNNMITEKLGLLWNKIEKPVKNLWNNVLCPIISDLNELLQDFFGESEEGISDFFTQAVDAGEEIGLIIEAVGVMLSTVWSFCKPILESLVGGISNVLKTTNNVIFSIIKALGNFFGVFKEIFLAIKNYGEGNTDEMMKHLKKAWAHFVNFFVGIGNAIIGVVNNLWSLIFDAFKGTVNAIGGLVAKLGSWMGYDWELHWDAEAPLIPNIPEYVPELATGAVIPGGSPFLAWLGDQPAGKTNIEAPENLLRQIVREESSSPNFTISATGNMAPLIRYLGLKISEEQNRASAF